MIRDECEGVFLFKEKNQKILQVLEIRQKAARKKVVDAGQSRQTISPSMQALKLTANSMSETQPQADHSSRQDTNWCQVWVFGLSEQPLSRASPSRSSGASNFHHCSANRIVVRRGETPGGSYHCQGAGSLAKYEDCGAAGATVGCGGGLRKL